MSKKTIRYIVRRKAKGYFGVVFAGSYRGAESMYDSPVVAQRLAINEGDQVFKLDLTLLGQAHIAPELVFTRGAKIEKPIKANRKLTGPIIQNQDPI